MDFLHKQMLSTDREIFDENETKDIYVTSPGRGYGQPTQAARDGRIQAERATGSFARAHQRKPTQGNDSDDCEVKTTPAYKPSRKKRTEDEKRADHRELRRRREHCEEPDNGTSTAETLRRADYSEQPPRTAEPLRRADPSGQPPSTANSKNDTVHREGQVDSATTRGYEGERGGGGGRGDPTCPRCGRRMPGLMMRTHICCGRCKRVFEAESGLRNHRCGGSVQGARQPMHR